MKVKTFFNPSIPTIKKPVSETESHMLKRNIELRKQHIFRKPHGTKKATKKSERNMFRRVSVF